MFRALTFAEVLAEERNRVIRETGWTSAARLGALCARTKDPKWCSQAREELIGAAKGTAEKVKKAAKGVAQSFKGPTDPEELKVKAEMRKEHLAQAADLRKQAEEGVKRRAEHARTGVDPEKGQHRAKDLAAAGELAKELDKAGGPRHLTGKRKGRIRKDWPKTASAFAFTYARS